MKQSPEMQQESSCIPVEYNAHRARQIRHVSSCLRCLYIGRVNPDLQRLRQIAQARENFFHIFTRFSRSAFVITDTELKLIAAAAIIGESNKPKTGYSTPAAIGMPSTL